MILAAGSSRVAVVRLLPRALLTCLVYRVRLWLRPVQTLNLAPPVVRSHSAPTAATLDISRAVSRAARLLPGTHCLPQSLAVRALMAHGGRLGVLQIGVSLADGFAAHAWVTENGQTVHGQQRVEFTALTPYGASPHP